MKAKQAYNNALLLLGYSDSANFQRKAIPIINQVLFDLSSSKEGKELKLISNMEDSLCFNNTIAESVIPLGIAEKLALSEGDGEMQQYFAVSYANAKKKLTRSYTITNVMP